MARTAARLPFQGQTLTDRGESGEAFSDLTTLEWPAWKSQGTLVVAGF